MLRYMIIIFLVYLLLCQVIISPNNVMPTAHRGGGSEGCSYTRIKTLVFCVVLQHHNLFSKVNKLCLGKIAHLDN